MMSGYAWAGVNSSVDDTIKIALIGCGDRGTGAAFQALSTKANIKLVALADAFQDRLDKSYNLLSERFKDKVDVPKERQFVGFDGYEKAIALADVVLLVTPPGFRPMHFEAPAFQIVEPNMNKDQVKGVTEQVKGKVNEAVGKATNNPGKELKGDLQQGAGKVQKACGDAKEDAKDNAKRNAP